MYILKYWSNKVQHFLRHKSINSIIQSNLMGAVKFNRRLNINSESKKKQTQRCDFPANSKYLDGFFVLYFVSVTYQILSIASHGRQYLVDICRSVISAHNVQFAAFSLFDIIFNTFYRVEWLFFINNYKQIIINSSSMDGFKWSIHICKISYWNVESFMPQIRFIYVLSNSYQILSMIDVSNTNDGTFERFNDCSVRFVLE